MRSFRFLMILAVLCLSASYSSAESLNIGLLEGADCYDISPESESDLENQRYWYKRIPPYVGFKRGENTTAGGDGSCIIGYPNINSDSALISINGKKVVLFPEPAVGAGPEILSSKDGALKVEILETGSETTCAPHGESCCGDYTYATITISNGNRSIKIKSANYSGS